MNSAFPRLKKVLFVSNGYGEDQIACHLISALWEHDPSIEVIACPLVGEGLEYKALSLVPICQNKMMPSAGFIRNPLHLVKDVFSGVIGTHWSQLRQLKSHFQDLEFTVAVGDVFCAMMSVRNNPSSVFFLPTAKSDFFMPHSFVEQALIKRYLNFVYPRDQLTSDSLKSFGINSVYLGNPMMDHLRFSEECFGFPKDSFVLGILPGSRQESYPNLCFILDIIDELDKLGNTQEFVIARAKTMDLKLLRSYLKATSWKLVYRDTFLGLLNSTTNRFIILSEKFPDVIKVSRALLGLAGTANEQAIYMGKTVFCFKGKGSQSSKKRFLEQSKLLGDSLRFIDEVDPAKLASVIYSMLSKMNAYESPISQLPNASSSIISHILKNQG